MAVRIDVAGETPASVTSTVDEQVIINATERPVVTTGTSVESVTIEVLKGAKGDQNVYVGDTPPDNPQEGWIWIDTSG